MQVYIAAYSWKYYPSENQIADTDMWELDKKELYVSSATLGCSIVLMAIYTGQTVFQNQKFGYSHLFLTLWLLVQIPGFVSHCQFERVYIDDVNNDEIDKYMTIHSFLY